jgi:pimeloyl-ACP methyl ester carboxylesterase
VPLLLVHGGVGPEITWSAQESLAERWKLLIPWRRGFPPSPSATRQDWMADAEDLEGLLSRERAHAVGFSYGGVGLTVAAGRAPDRLLSLTLIEVPLFELADGKDPELRELLALAASYTAAGEPPAAVAAAFEALAGMGGELSAEQQEELERVRRLARGLRPPGEAHPDYEAIVGAGVPVLIVSGGHQPGLERLCDAIAARLLARRECIAGAGHAVQRAPGFNQLLADFAGRSTE